MRTKKIISVLFAAIMALSVFGVIGASADVTAQSNTVASVGWLDKTVAPTYVFVLDDKPELTSSLDQAVVVWEVFVDANAAAAAGGIVRDGYASQKSYGYVADPIWKVTKADGTDVPVFANAQSAVNQNTIAYRNSTTGQEQLFIKQGKTPYYGKLNITLTISARVAVNGQAIGTVPVTNTSDTKTVELAKPTDLQDAIKEAKDIIAKGRYKSDYIDSLKALVALAEPMQYSAIYSQATVDQMAADLKAVNADAKNHYKLSGWAFLDDLLGNGFMGFIWGVVDFFGKVMDIYNTVSVIFGPIGKLFSAIGSAFGFIMPIFNVFSGLL